MNKPLIAWLFVTSLYSVPAWSQSLNVRIPLGYDLLRQVLVKQLYKAPGQVAQLANDKHGCRFFNLSDPQLSGEAGQIKINNQVKARIGTAIGGTCLTLLEWSGRLETLQQPTLNAKGTVLRFPVTQIRAYDLQGRELEIAELQQLIKKAAEPKLANLKIDLDQVRGDMATSLTAVVAEQHRAQLDGLLDSLKFNAINADADKVLINIGLQLPQGMRQAAKTAPAQPLNDDEWQQWQDLWQAWDGRLSQFIRAKTSGTTQSRLLSLLQDAGDGLKVSLTTENSDGRDPVRRFFSRAWETNAPHLRELSQQAPGAESLRYLTFIAATDVLYELDNIGAPFGISLSSDGLRRLARRILARQRT